MSAVASTIFMLALMLNILNAQATSSSDMPEGMLKRETPIKRNVEHPTKFLNIENVKKWPERLEAPVNYEIRDVFKDPIKVAEATRQAEELARQAALKAAQDAAVKGATASKQEIRNRIRTALSTQTNAWEQFLARARLTSVMRSNKDSIAVFTLKDSSKSYRLRLDQKVQIEFDGEFRQTRKNLETSTIEDFLPLETITIRLIKFTSNALFFRIEEVNGVAYFTDEQPVWAYEYQTGAL